MGAKWANFVIREMLLEMIEYEIFTCLVSFCDQIYLHQETKKAPKKYSLSKSCMMQATKAINMLQFSKELSLDL